jgi:hypothetical protein
MCLPRPLVLATEICLQKEIAYDIDGYPCHSQKPSPVRKTRKWGGGIDGGARIRTNDLWVMSCNPISCTLACRATRLGAAWRYSILKSLV